MRRDAAAQSSEVRGRTALIGPHRAGSSGIPTGGAAAAIHVSPFLERIHVAGLANDRTQEVAGSSPASSIRSPCKRRCLRAVAAALRLAACG